MNEFEPHKTSAERIVEILKSVSLHGPDESKQFVQFGTEKAFFSSSASSSIDQAYTIAPTPEIIAFMEFTLERPVEEADYARFFVELVPHVDDQFGLKVSVNGQARNGILGIVPIDLLAGLKASMRQDFIAKKEVFDSTPPFERARSHFRESQIRAILMSSQLISIGWRDTAIHTGDTLWLSLPSSMSRALHEQLCIEDVAGANSTGSQPPLFWVIPNDDLKLFFAEHMVYGSSNLKNNYYLEVLDRGDGDVYLMAKYSHIIGSRKLGKIPADLLEAMNERFDALLREKMGKSARAPAISAPAIADPELMEQTASLIPASNRLELPEGHLSRYADIKNVMLKAGGKYKSPGKGLPAHFVFHASTNTADLLEKIVGGQKVNIQKETQFFATPKAQAVRLVESLGPKFVVGARVLEPSAGDAAIADVAKEMGASSVVTIENWSINAEVLRSKGYDPIERDFLEVRPEQTGLFQAVLMNPPFSGRQDIAHVRHALSFLNPDGRLGAITSVQYETSSVKDSQRFKTLLELASAETRTIERGAFKESGTTVATSMITIDMELLLNRLQELGTDGSELGVDLSRQWLAREDHQAMHSSDAHRLSEARP